MPSPARWRNHVSPSSFSEARQGPGGGSKANISPGGRIRLRVDLDPAAVSDVLILRALAHGLDGTAVHLLERHVLLVRGDCPQISEAVLNLPIAVAPEAVSGRGLGFGSGCQGEAPRKRMVAVAERAEP